MKRMAKVTCVRCGKFWFEPEPDECALCPICEASVDELDRKPPAETDESEVDSDAPP